MHLPKSLSASLLAAALLAACGGDNSPFIDDGGRAPLVPQQNLLNLINTARSQPRLCGTDAYQAAPALVWNNALRDAAEAHSRDMASRQFFEHNAPAPAPNGVTPADRAERFGYSRYVGENIAAGYRTAEEVMEGWLKSPGHCRNIMNPDYRAVGMGYAYTGEGSYRHYWTQVFGL